MSRLYTKSAEARGYNFDAVKKDDSRIDGGLTAPDGLYISINVDNAHGNFIRVAIMNKTIQPLDLQAMNTTNNKYLQAAENYMYDTLTTTLEGERQDFNIWKRGWTTTDESETPPRQ